MFNENDIHKEECIVPIEVYNKQHNEKISEMKKYIQSLKEMDPNRAKKLARKNLISSGVMNKNGTMKKNICD